MKKILISIAAMAVIAFALIFVGLAYRNAQIEKLENDISLISDQLIKDLDTRQKISQLFMLYYPLDHLDAIREYYPGTIFINRSNIPENKDGSQNLELLSIQIQQINREYLEKGIPAPLYSIDQEGGHVRRIKSGITEFPSQMATGEAVLETGHTDLPMLGGFYTCRQLKKLGIQWPLTPVADVQTNPENPVIGVRSFGSDPEEVSRMVSQYLTGLHTARCSGTIKHFPGHGDTNQDSHKTLPYINRDIDSLHAVELYPFRETISGKNPPHAIMTAHVVFSGIAQGPATLSKEWLTDLIRNQWNFEGLIVTDDLAMEAIPIYQKNHPEIKNTAFSSFKAGSDILLFIGTREETRDMVNGFINIYQSLNAADKAVFEQRIDQSLKRLIKRKIKLGVLDNLISIKMNSWEPYLQEAATLVLKHSSETDQNINRIESQLALAEKINQFASSKGIKTLLSGEAFPDDIAELPLYSNLSSESLNNIVDQMPATDSENQIQEITRQGTQIKHNLSAQPLTTINQTGCTMGCVVIYTQWKDLCSALPPVNHRKKDSIYIIYTTANPFPASSVKKCIGENDILITTFSHTPQSINSLIELYLSGKEPPAAKVTYH